MLPSASARSRTACASAVSATIGEAVKFPKVSIHIPAYRESPEMIRQTLDAVAQLEYPNFECVVIINNTPDPAFWQPIQDHCRGLGERFEAAVGLLQERRGDRGARRHARSRGHPRR